MSSEKEQYLAIIAAALDFAGDGQKRLVDQAAALVAAVAAVQVKVVQVEARMAELARAVRANQIICSPADPVGALIADYNRQLDVVNAFWNGGDCDLEKLAIELLPRNWAGSIETSVQSALRYIDGVVTAAADFPRQPRQLLDGYKNSLNEWKVLDKAESFRVADALLSTKTEEYSALCARNPLPLSELAAFFAASGLLRLKTVMASADQEQQHLCRIARQKSENLQRDTERQNRERREKELKLAEERQRKLKEEERQLDEELRRNAEKRRLEDEERRRAEEQSRRAEERRRVEAESDSRHQQVETSLEGRVKIALFVVAVIVVVGFLLYAGRKKKEEVPAEPTPAPEMAAPAAVPAAVDTDQQLMANGQWRDPNTGMIWMRCNLGQHWDGATCKGKAKSYTWAKAQQAVARLNQRGGFGGYTDWVLPHIQDLSSLVSCSGGYKGMYDVPSKSGGMTSMQLYCLGKFNRPTIDSHVFPATASYYGNWSSTSYADDGNNAWLTSFDDGGIYFTNKASDQYVRVVRSGQ